MLPRSSTACFALDEFEAAREAFQAGLAVEPANSAFKTWLRKCEAELAGRAPFYFFYYYFFCDTTS